MATLQTTIRNRIGDLEGVRNLVSEFVRAGNLSEKIEFDINVVLDELLSNIIKYGYADDATHEIHITLAASDTATEITIEDDGKAFDPLTAPEPDLTLPLAARPIGGLGIHFVRKLMDEVVYRRRDDRNYMFLKKNIS